MEVLQQPRLCLVPAIDLTGMRFGGMSEFGKRHCKGADLTLAAAARDGPGGAKCALLNYVVARCPRLEKLYLSGLGGKKDGVEAYLLGWAGKEQVSVESLVDAIERGGSKR